jgi:hypothetical protein
MSSASTRTPCADTATRSILLLMKELAVEEQEDLIPVSEDMSFQDISKNYLELRARKRGPLKREAIARAYSDAFELIGGVPRLALFGNANPEAFYKLHARLIPSESKQQFDGRIEIVGFIQPTALDEDEPNLNLVSEQ